MCKLIKCWCLVCALMILVLPLSFAESADNETVVNAYDSAHPEKLEAEYIYGASAILMDTDSGEVLFSKNPDQKMYPASTTKIMTCLLALESGIDPDTEIVVPQQASQIPSDSSLIPVMPGDQLSFIDLLYGFMINSGNDGANAIAVIVGGSVEDFVARMNKRAAELGCTGTHFANAHGYHDENHYTTARDLALIAQAALQYDTFKQIVSCVNYTVHIQRDGEEIELDLITRNAMLRDTMSYYYRDCIGVKTGFHSAAGYCYVSAAERDGVRLLTVDLNAGASVNDKWTDAIRMFDYGFTNYEEYTLEEMFKYAGDQIAVVKVSNASRNDDSNGILELELAQISNGEYARLVKIGNQNAFSEAIADFVSRCRLTIDDNLVAPIERGEVLGTFSYTAQTGEIITARLIASRDIEEQPASMTLRDFIPILNYLDNPLVTLLLLTVAALIILVIVYMIGKHARNERKRKAIFERRRRELVEQYRKQSTYRALQGHEKKKSHRDEDDDEDLFFETHTTRVTERGSSRTKPSTKVKRHKTGEELDRDLFGGF